MRRRRNIGAPRPSGTMHLMPALDWSALVRLSEARAALGQLSGTENASQRPAEYGGDGWSGGGWDQSLTWLRDGWLDGVKHADALAITETGVAPDADWELEVAGFFPLVPAYLSGDPACMMQRVEIDKPRKRVALAFNNCYSACVTVDEIMVYASAVAALMAELQAGGVDVALYTLDSGGDWKTNYVTPITVRAFGEPLDMSKLVYSFHPSFLRRILFAYRESNQTLREAGQARAGYGHVMQVTREQLVQAIGDIGADCIMLPDVNDVASSTGDSTLRQAPTVLLEQLRELVRGKDAGEGESAAA